MPHGIRPMLLDEATLDRQRTHRFKYEPLISIIVPAYQTPTEFLKQMIDSVTGQTYGVWELCIANASPDNEEMQRILAEYAAGMRGCVFVI